jgi:hypothetical protein
MSSVIEKLTSVLSEDQFIILLKRMFELVGATYVDSNGKQRHIQFGGDNFDLAMEEVFTGRLFTIYPVLLLVLEVNYPDFFAKAVPLIGSRFRATGGLEQAEQNESESLNGSEKSGN